MSSGTISKSPAKEVCYSDDETMQRRLLRKRQLEDSESYNSPEAMAVKRRNVKQAAKMTPVPKKIPNLTFDDQIDPSETLEHEDEDDVPLHAEEKGSNAAQSGVGALHDVVVVDVPIRSQKDIATVDADADRKEVKDSGKAGVDRRGKGGATKAGKKGASKKGAKEVAGAKATKVKPERRVHPVLVKVTLDPGKWEQKSDPAARRSRHRLRRLLREEEEALLSSQLQAV